MASISRRTTPATDRTAALTTFAPGSARFDWLATIFTAWLTGGLFTDGWAHTHIPNLETFFTPWHAVLYSGMASNGVYLGVAWLRGISQGRTWRFALPRGYLTALIGVVVFTVGGVLDLTWHLINGIERNTAALLSPTHLMLALGVALIVTGPLRGALARVAPGPASWTQLGPAVLALAALSALLMFFTQFSDQVVASQADKIRASETSIQLGIVGTLLQMAIVTGPLLFAAARWRLPFGTVAVFLGVHGGLSAVLAHNVAPLSVAVIFALLGLLIDGFYVALTRPAPANIVPWRVFAFGIPFIIQAIYFPLLALAHHGLGWETNLWSGTIVMSGVVGLFLSYLIQPPQMTTP